MAKRKEIIIEKDDFSDDIDVGFAASDENLDLIVRELDLVTQFLERDEQNQSIQRSRAKNRERVNQAKREWFKAHPEKVREYNSRRDKEAERKRARELYQGKREQERERQRIIREKRRAAKLAQQAATSESQSPSVAEKINQGTNNITKRKQRDMGNITNSKGDMEL